MGGWYVPVWPPGSQIPLPPAPSAMTNGGAGLDLSGPPVGPTSKFAWFRVGRWRAGVFCEGDFTETIGTVFSGV